jgi:transposase-like protein
MRSDTISREDLMGKRTKKYSPQFKFKVVLETFQRDSVAEVARQYDVHPNQVTMWRREFQTNGAKVFDTGTSKREEQYRKRITQLENLMGKKELEISLLKEFLDFYSPPDGS